MRSFQSKAVIALAVAALSWSATASADDVHKKHQETKGASTTTTPQAPTTTTTTGSSSADVDEPVDGTSTTTTTTTNGNGTGSVYGPANTESYGAQGQEPKTTTYSTTTTTAADYDESVAADRPSGYMPNRPMLITGGVLFLGTYAASAIVATTNDNSYDNKLYIPVVGPWLDMADRPCGLGDCGSREDVNQALLIGSGVAQGVGIGMTIAAFLVNERAGEVRFGSPAERSRAALKPTVQVTPLTFRGGSGIGALGTF